MKPISLWGFCSFLFFFSFFFFFTSKASTITSSRYRLRPGSSFGNGSSLSNLMPQPQTLNVELTLHLVEAALGFPPQRAILQHVCLIKLDFACSKRSLQFIFTQTAAVISQKLFFIYFFFFTCSHWKNNSLTVCCICPSSCSGCEGSHCSSLA